ncbi:MAG TPA: pitrilysin family protein [Candidatus Kapabacteria bacterium]|nr:pitrilysin family protein [Candidatus Kapabacteria bacterium]
MTFSEARTAVQPGGMQAAYQGADAYHEFMLGNGLRVLLHQDRSTPIVTINVLYHVGSKNEQRGGTGFAHLFEHLMFDGSKNVDRGGYDRYCTSVGGDNNAFTSSDITDYYVTLPGDQLALGLWLESDRMAEFAIREVSLETQKNVVIEEKRQNIDDVPYGDAMVAMREIAYGPQHPYSWDTIGSMEDIVAARMEDVRAFYLRYYVPSNATLVVAGNFDPNEAREMVEQYFGPIPAGGAIDPVAPDPALLRQGMRRVISSSIVPFNAVFLGYHAPSIYSEDVPALELLAAMLTDGESSRLYQALEYTQQIASEAECFLDDGELGTLVYIYAVGQETNISTKRLEKALRAEVERLVRNGVGERELEKVKHRKVTRIVHALQSVSSRAERLAYFTALFRRPELAFHEADLYAAVTREDLVRVARTYLLEQEPNVIEYVRSK